MKDTFPLVVVEVSYEMLFVSHHQYIYDFWPYQDTRWVITVVYQSIYLKNLIYSYYAKVVKSFVNKKSLGRRD
jgi:hypothetical protein